jgi:hypothetical protein
MRGSGKATFGAVGDISFLKGVNVAAEAHGLDWPFERMKPQLDRADLLFGNMETVLIPPDYPRDQVDPRGLIAPFDGEDVAAALRRAGFDFLNLAANHVLDAGVVGMDYTQAVLEAAGLMTAGVGHTQEEARQLYRLERNGITFGFLCYCEDSNYSLGTRGPCHAYYERESVLEDVAAHRREVDILVVSVHADLEFMPVPSMPRLRIFREIAAAGADIVLGHHPHVPQGCERVGKSLIAYSLGNFVFPAHTSVYMRSHGPHTAHSFLLLAEVTREGVQSFERVPFEIAAPPEERPVPLEGSARQAKLDYLAMLDAYLADEAFVRDTWREVARRRFASYLKAAMHNSSEPKWRRWIRTQIARFGFGPGPDVDRVIEEFVGRLCLTQENRNWMEEILAMGREAHEARILGEIDPLHRPQYRLDRAEGRRRA